jgi:hypothetical protein
MTGKEGRDDKGGKGTHGRGRPGLRKEKRGGTPKAELFGGGGFGGCFFGMEVVEDGLGLLAVDDSGECFSVGVAHGF